MSFKAAHNKFKWFFYFFSWVRLKILASRNIINCHKFANNFVSLSGLVLKIKILMQKKIKIKTGGGASAFFITSIILSIKKCALSIYLSFLPANKIKQILSNDLIFFFVSAPYPVKKLEASDTLSRYSVKMSWSLLLSTMRSMILTQQCNVFEETMKKSSLLKISNTSYFNSFVKLFLFSIKLTAT